jgi:hypothetical protein
MLDGVLERGPADAERARRELHARPVEDAHQPMEALALPAEPAVICDETLLEVQLTGREAAAAHLVEAVTDHEAGVVPFDHERGDAPRARAGGDRGKDDAHIRQRGVADELLVTVDHIAALDTPGLGRDRRGVRAGAGLGDRDRADRRVEVADRAQPAGLLLLRSQLEQGMGEEGALGDHPRDRAVAPGHLFDHPATVAQARDPAAAVFRGKVVASQAECRGLAQEFMGELLGFVVAQGDRSQLLEGEVARDGDQLIDLADYRSCVHTANWPCMMCTVVLVVPAGQ